MSSSIWCQGSADASTVYLDSGYISYLPTDNGNYVLCVHNDPCEEDKFWDGSACVNPCEPNPCATLANSTHECTATAWNKYECECDDGYFWVDLKCSTSPFPECTNSSDTPCKDSANGHFWSEKYTEKTWLEAFNHCSGLNLPIYGGGWHLPTISELRTLVQDCPATQMPPSGNDTCGVREDDSVTCLSNSCWNYSCDSCSEDHTGGHSKLGDTGIFWSSSIYEDYSENAWYLHFTSATVDYIGKNGAAAFRCVK